MDAIVIVSESKNAAAAADAAEQFNNGDESVNGSIETVTSVFTGETQSYLRKDHQILVSSNKKPFLFYLNLAKKFLNQYDIVELSALGTAITTLIIISENLKRNGWAIEKSVTISTVPTKRDKSGRLFYKAKIDILLQKAGQVVQTTAATCSKKDADNKAIPE